jgi:integrase
MAEKRSAGKMEPVAKNPGIYRRNGRYIVTVWNPDKGKAGGKEWQSLPDGATLAQAKALKRKMETEKANGRRRGTAKEATVAEWVGFFDGDAWVPGRWLELVPRKAESTNMHNDSRVRAFAREFAGRSLSSITEEEAAGFALQNPGSFKEVHAMMNDACAKRLIERNPFAGIKVRSREGRRNIVVLTDDELEQLCGIARAVHGPGYGPLFAAMIKMAAWTGLRPGELFLLSLEPGDQLNFADLDAGVVHVDWQLSSKTGKVGRPKKESQREVILLPGAEDALRSIKSWTTGLPVFLTKRGKPFNQRTHFYYWDPVRAAFVASLLPGHHLRQRQAEEEGANLDFYELRHFFGTKLAHPPAGVPAASPYEIAAMMGHKDGGQLAMERYIHVGVKDAGDSIRRAWRRAS